MAEEVSQIRQMDHDLLIEINTKLGRVILDVKELKDNTAQRVDNLESEKLDKAEADRLSKDANTIHEDHEERLRRVERWGLIAVGAIALIQLIPVFSTFIKSIISK